MRLRTFGCAIALTALALAPAACDRNNRSDLPVRHDIDRDGRDDRTERGVSGTAGTLENAAERAGTAVSDSALTAKIQAKFVVDDVVKSHKIDVDTNDGVVTLKGTVNTKTEQDRAEMIAKQTDGVKRVVNNLMVDANAKRDDDRDNRPAGTTGAKTNNGNIIEDGWITTKIQSQYLADDVVKGRRIDVDTNKGVVTLKGTVRSKLEHDKAVDIARRTDGVKSVNDSMLQVDPNAK